MPFIFKLAANLLLAWNLSVPMCTLDNDCKSTIPYKFLHVAVKIATWNYIYVLINGNLFGDYALFINEIFGQLLSNYSCYVAII